MDDGFIKIHRKMLNWEWFTDPNTLAVFLYLLLNANWEDSRFKGIDVPRGSLITGRKKIAKDLNISERSVRTSINHLKTTNEVTTKTTNKFTLVTIVKWDYYQGYTRQTDQQNDQQNANNRPTSDHIKEYKEYKNIRIKEYNKRETKFTPPTLEEVRDYCQERKNGIDPGSFIDFYQSKGWKVGNQSMKDWKACVRTWESKRKKENEKGYISGHYDFDKLEKEAREAAGK